MSINSGDNRSSTKASKNSTHLSNEENELVFRLVGRRSVSQCTTIAQLYQTEGPTNSRWIKKHTGALCFIKDNGKRSYYCRMFCLMRHEMVWEQEMYDTIDITRTRPYLLTFEGQVMLTKHDNLHKAFEWVNETIHTLVPLFLWGGFLVLCDKFEAMKCMMLEEKVSWVASKFLAQLCWPFRRFVLGRNRGAEFRIRRRSWHISALRENNGR